ncbi:hypothetical protein Csa_013608 [Cucumis sativus]|uniref:Uncharacterized protein n=1 Tax=Cucumis sativus TaxID=3659 RepID=A0A0A0LRT4_CUCSA|nr:hypothetical protein Csa_013608 [Cucumis sativus]
MSFGSILGVQNADFGKVEGCDGGGVMVNIDRLYTADQWRAMLTCAGPASCLLLLSLLSFVVDVAPSHGLFACCRGGHELNLLRLLCFLCIFNLIEWAVRCMRAGSEVDGMLEEDPAISI